MSAGDQAYVIEMAWQVEEMTLMQEQVAFFEEAIDLSSVEVLEGKLKALLEQPVQSVEELEAWMHKRAELFEQIQEVMSGVYISYNRDNGDSKLRERYTYHQEVVQPLLKKYSFLLNTKLNESPYTTQLPKEIYGPLIRSVQTALSLYREENIALEVEESKLEQEYFDITSHLTVEWQGEEKTFPQMKEFLQSTERSVRQEAWKLIAQELAKHEQRLNEIMSQLITLRHQKAVNAGLANYRDYMFQVYEREDYTAEDCFLFYENVKKHVVPLADQIKAVHQQDLGVDRYKLWDMQAVPKGQERLRPFSQVTELIKGVEEIFASMDQTFAKMFQGMVTKNMLDLESRKGKSPGGFCSFLPVSGESFIFMNATDAHDDLTTLIHEGGHSVHNMLTKDILPKEYQSVPMEAAELASMSMELLTMDKWDVFYSDAQELRRAQKEQLEDIITFFPWAMVVDQFQHWLYTHPEHTVAERREKFLELAKELSHHYVDTEGQEAELAARWLLQLHIFEVPFYYIEYAIAQLGALQVWNLYTENPQLALEKYKQALALGSSKSLKEIYATAGIRFDFSEQTIKQTINFAKEKWEEVR